MKTLATLRGHFIDRTLVAASRLANNKCIHWNEEEIEAFEELKNAFNQYPVRYFPDPNVEIILETDTSNYSVGAYLYQKDPMGGPNRPIAFVSKSLQGAQVN